MNIYEVFTTRKDHLREVQLKAAIINLCTIMTNVVNQNLCLNL